MLFLSVAVFMAAALIFEDVQPNSHNSKVQTHRKSGPAIKRSTHASP
jgi:hypothetical protein